MLYDIAKPEDSENFHGHLRLHQNTRTKRFLIRQNVNNNCGLKSIVRQCIQKRNKFPRWLRMAKNENIFQKMLNDFFREELKVKN